MPWYTQKAEADKSKQSKNKQASIGNGESVVGELEGGFGFGGLSGNWRRIGRTRVALEGAAGGKMGQLSAEGGQSNQSGATGSGNWRGFGGAGTEWEWGSDMYMQGLYIFQTLSEKKLRTVVGRYATWPKRSSAEAKCFFPPTYCSKAFFLRFSVSVSANLLLATPKVVSLGTIRMRDSHTLTIHQMNSYGGRGCHLKARFDLRMDIHSPGYCKYLSEDSPPSIRVVSYIPTLFLFHHPGTFWSALILYHKVVAARQLPSLAESTLSRHLPAASHPYFQPQPYPSRHQAKIEGNMLISCCLIHLVSCWVFQKCGYTTLLGEFYIHTFFTYSSSVARTEMLTVPNNLHMQTVGAVDQVFFCSDIYEKSV
ncbi:hypothetical protein VP01_17g8 [Puccinia sorghi]|uniref:Uncharacterized protein n=1 Tax=Puccinia sorghi TaxID=27349 RepID=A0A0L6VE94_9BASI|nr:hypothetical protein VP01_17g8 [Puccinia sorghi]